MKLIVEPARELPLVWFEIAVRGGSAADPEDGEGHQRHLSELARRGAGDRDRAALDEAFDRLGASLSVSTGRDSCSLFGLCLARHVDRVVDLVADVLRAPQMSELEHDKLIREALHTIDEIRDDDNTLAQRFFARYAAPGHPYSRTAFGTPSSIAALRLDAARADYRRAVVPDNLVVAFAGDLDDDRAARLADRLTDGLPRAAAPPLPDVSLPPPRAGRRTYLIDKPERTQCQIQMGHAAPRYGTDEYMALTLAESVFGGSFTSRMMQEIRVKRGWSYGAGCRLGRARGHHWLRMYLAPSSEVAPEALALTLQLHEQLARDGIRDKELDFVRGYLAGAWTFQKATARDRMRLRLNAAVCGWDDDLVDTWPERTSAVTNEQATAAIARWIRPDEVVSVIVGTADDLLPRLRDLPLGELTVVPYEDY